MEICFCVNVKTSEPHNEDNCSYTVITVLKQQAMIGKKEYKSKFKLNTGDSIALIMNQPMTFMFWVIF